MTARFANWDDATFDLAVQQCTVGLDTERQAELTARVDRQDFEELEHVAAAISLSQLERLEAPPARLLERLEQAGRQHVADASPSATAARPPTRRAGPRGLWIGVSGWLVAASLAFIAFGPLDAFVPRSAPETPGARARYEELVASAEDLLRLEWSPTEDPAARGASGEVVWSASRQEGYMRFEGLDPNDPEENQYQLWIFDSSRADWEAEPVDGGVFDVTDGEDDLVPIDPKLVVREAVLFAVTVEEPGGVVVSDRERLALTAEL